MHAIFCKQRLCATQAKNLLGFMPQSPRSLPSRQWLRIHSERFIHTDRGRHRVRYLPRYIFLQEIISGNQMQEINILFISADSFAEREPAVDVNISVLQSIYISFCQELFFCAVIPAD